MSVNDDYQEEDNERVHNESREVHLQALKRKKLIMAIVYEG